MSHNVDLVFTITMSVSDELVQEHGSVTEYIKEAVGPEFRDEMAAVANQFNTLVGHTAIVNMQFDVREWRPQ